MKNNIYFLLTILFFLSSCQSKFDNPLAQVDKALAQPEVAQTGFSNVRLFTTERALSSSRKKQLMKMSIDYDTQFDKMGIFLFLDDQNKNQQTFKELANIDLSNDIDADSKYVGRKIFSLTEEKFSHDIDSLTLRLNSHENGKKSNQTIATFNLREPNSYPFGIQDFKRNNIKQNEMIRMYSFDLREGNGVHHQTGYHGKLISVFYDSSKKEELLHQLDWNRIAILKNYSDQLALPNQVAGSKFYYGNQSDFQGFAFGEDGE